jgi:hypothetical protein
MVGRIEKEEKEGYGERKGLVIEKQTKYPYRKLR